MLVPEDRLKINLRALVEKAINRWSETQPLGFTRPLVEDCGDFIAAEMDARGLRHLTDGDPWFNDKATAQEFRDCVFAALDDWLVRAEISGEAVSEGIETESRNSEHPPVSHTHAVPFSTPGYRSVPQIDSYVAFDESWGPVDLRERKTHPLPEQPPLPSVWRKAERQPDHRYWLWAFIILAALAIVLFDFILPK